MHIKIRGEDWIIKDVKMKDFGECCSAENTIRIRIDQRPKTRLASVIHELLHATCTYLEDDEVEIIEQVLAKGLWKDRWRRITEI